MKILQFLQTLLTLSENYIVVLEYLSWTSSIVQFAKTKNVWFFDKLEAKFCVYIEIDCTVNEDFGLVVANGKSNKKMKK